MTIRLRLETSLEALESETKLSINQSAGQYLRLVFILQSYYTCI
jgi:hypothetical protein